MRIYSVTRSSRSNSLPIALNGDLTTVDGTEFRGDRLIEETSTSTQNDCLIEEPSTTNQNERLIEEPLTTTHNDHRIIEEPTTKTSNQLQPHLLHPGWTPRENSEDPNGPLTFEPAQDTPYISIQAPDASLVTYSGQTTSGSEGNVDNSTPLRYGTPVAHRGRLFAKTQKNKRLVQKNGHSNVTIAKVEKRRRKYFRDFFTTIMEMKWRYHIFLFISAFVLSWLLFGLGWLGLAHYHGDIERWDNDTVLPCVENVYDFSTAFLFSIETQTTIGYGYRMVGPNCPVGTSMLMFQSCVGVFIQCFITGIIFAKVARPKRRAQTIVFSHHAVICVRDGFYNLIFRVGDLRKTHIIGTSIRALMVKSRETSEGELMPLCQYPLDLVTESSITDSFVFFFWPVTIAHRITESSPFWDLTAESILADHFEVIIILEGTVQTSGALIQIKTSYIPNEIKWGQRLTPLVTNLRDDDEYEINYSNFHDTTPVSMPECSAKEYSERMATDPTDVSPSDYLASFSSAPSLNKRYSFGRSGKSIKLPSLFHRNRSGIRHKTTRTGRRKAIYDDAENGDSDRDDTATVASLSEVIVHSPPPPTYASIHVFPSNDDVELASIGTLTTTVTIHDETQETHATLQESPIWSRSGEHVNQAFKTNLA